MGLYIDCVIAGQLCRALVDTGSTICLLRQGVLPGTAGPLPADWTPTTTELLTVTGEKTVMPGKKLLPVVVGAQQISHEFWLADIRDDCIVGLDLLAHWGACVDVPGSAICLGAETIPLRSGRSAAGESQRRRGSCTARASAPQPPHRDHRSPAQAGQERQRRRRGSRTARASAPQPPHRDHRSPAQAGQERQRRRRGSRTARASAPQQPHRDHRSPAQAGQERQRRRRGSRTARASAPQQPHRDHRSPAQAGQERQRTRRGSRTARASAPQQPHRDHRSPAQAGQERQRTRRGSRTARASAPQQPHRDHRSPAQAGQEGQRRHRGNSTARASAPQQPHRDHRSPAQAGQEGQRRHRGNSTARASVPQQPPPRAYAPPSDETAAAVAELAQRSGGHLDAAQRQQLNRLLQDFDGLVQHHIDTGDAPPIRLRPHRLPLVKRQAAQELIESMVANDIIEPSDSPWAAPMVMVRKKTGKWRPCVDYRRLNAVTKKDSYPLPRNDDALDYVAGSCWFSSLDLRSGYWQVELAPEARSNTAFTIGQGLWQFKVMPFGLCNAPATLERLMERVLKDIPRSRCVVYLDDLLVHAKGFEDAINNLAGVFMAICQAGLRLNPAKCHLLARETQFLGHVVNEHGVTTDRAKVAAIKEWPQPTTTSELRSFLGLASYYRRFVKDFATIASPLHRVTEKGRRFGWSEACSRAFQRLKVDLSEAPVLAYPDPQQPFIVDTDASGTGERVVAYYNCSLSRPERNYCVTRRELLAVVLAVRHFRPYLLGTRWLEILQEYDFDIQHRPGRQHGNADALSQRPCLLDECRYCRRHEERELGPSTAAVTTGEGEPFSREQLQQHQEMDPVLAEVRSWLETQQRPEWPAISARGPEIKLLHSQWGSLELCDGILQSSTGGGGHQVLRWVQGSAGAGHFGNSKTVRRLRQRFYWPGCRQDAELHVHWCDDCTAQKGPTQRSRGPVQQYLVGAPMERVGVDILGPFPTTEDGNRYILVAMDYFTKWPAAYAVPDQTATTAAQRLVEDMFSRFGVPEELHSDQGRNFESRTTPLHPQSDGLVERFNRTLATQLAILTSQHQKDWDQHLPLVLWAYRTAVQESSQCTPATLMFGRELQTPVDLVFGPPPEPEITGGPELDYLRRLKERLSVVHQLARESQGDAGARQKRAYDGRCHGHPFAVGDNVWVYCPVRKRGLSPKLTSHWQGPGEILDRISEVVYRVRMPGRGRRVVLHRDRLAPYHPLAPNPVTEPEDSLLSATPSASMNNG
ncbi:hypothetical protein Q8A73_014443 [Channa argus]|nr:hypothetical protein Q8A73_014443 [Channa argus]